MPPDPVAWDDFSAAPAPYHGGGSSTNLSRWLTSNMAWLLAVAGVFAIDLLYTFSLGMAGQPSADQLGRRVMWWTAVSITMSLGARRFKKPEWGKFAAFCGLCLLLGYLAPSMALSTSESALHDKAAAILDDPASTDEQRAEAQQTLELEEQMKSYAAVPGADPRMSDPMFDEKMFLLSSTVVICLVIGVRRIFKRGDAPLPRSA